MLFPRKNVITIYYVFDFLHSSSDSIYYMDIEIWFINLKILYSIISSSAFKVDSVDGYENACPFI